MSQDVAVPVTMTFGNVPLEVTEELAHLQSRVAALTEICRKGEVLDLASVVRLHIERVVELAGGNRSKAARLLGISRSTLKRKGY